MRTLSLAVFVSSSLVFAQAPAKPSPEAVKSVWTYYSSGKGQGPVLADAKLCTEIGKEGDKKFECTVEVGPDGVKAGTNVMLWQAYLVPQGDSIEDLTVQVKQGNTVRETKDVKVKGDSWRARQWTGVRLPKPGSWTITVNRGAEVLKELTIKVY